LSFLSRFALGAIAAGLVFGSYGATTAVRDGGIVKDGEFVKMVGHDSLGDRVEMIWASDGGDVKTTSSAGLADEVWFRGNRLVQKDIFGGTEELGGYAPWESAQLNRVVVTGGLANRKPIRRTVLANGGSIGAIAMPSPLRPIGVSWDPDGNIVIANSIFHPDFSGAYAKSWTNGWGVRFTLDNAPEAVPTFPAPPQSAWLRPTQGEEPVAASIDGHDVQTIVDTAEGGLGISEGLVQRLGLRTMTWAGSLFLPTKPAQLAILDNVILAGVHVRSIAARIVPGANDRLYAGIDLFPDAGLVLNRSGDGRVTGRRCADGIPALMREAKVVVHGPDLPPRESKDPNARRHQTLLDSTLGGPAIFTAGIPPSVYDRMLHDPIEATRIMYGGKSRDCPEQPATIAFHGRTFSGRQRVCYEISMRHSNADAWDVRLGLASLDAKTLLVDTRDESICWPS
jgi:hypothetical protein